MAESNYALLAGERVSALIDKTILTVSADLDNAFFTRQGATIHIETLRGEVMSNPRAAPPELVIHRLKQVLSKRLSITDYPEFTIAVDRLTSGKATAKQLLQSVRLCSDKDAQKL